MSMVERDYLMRQIRMLVRFIASTLLGKPVSAYADGQEADAAEANALHAELNRLLDQGRICQAEDLLFARLDAGGRKTLEAALDFYLRLNDMDDEALERGNFSRTEIEQGLREVAARFGLTL